MIYYKGSRWCTNHTDVFCTPLNYQTSFRQIYLMQKTGPSMPLFENFDTINHSLLIAKLNAHSLSFNAIKFVQSNLSDRFQKANINNNFSELCITLLGLPQWLILGPRLFNIFINNDYFFIQDVRVCNFADDNSLYSIENKFKL